MSARPFPSQAAFRAWLLAHHAKATELVVRCYKVHAKASGMSYVEAVEEALCFGWIDGVTRRFDEDSYAVRFTPRKAKSRWSVINLNRVKQLEAAGRMHAAGLAAFQARTGEPAGYAFESPPQELPEAGEKRFRANRKAWAFFQAQPPWYRRTSTHWVVSAKRPETRERRLTTLIADSAAGRTIAPLTRP